MNLAALVLSTVATVQPPASVTVSLSMVPSGSPVSAEHSCTIRATPLGGRGTTLGTPVDSGVQVPGEVSLTLAANTVWRFEVMSNTFWAAPVTSYVTAAGATVTLRLWRAGELSGRLVPSNHEPLPEQIRVRFRAAAKQEKLHRPFPVDEPNADPQGEQECQVKVGTFHCRVPATSLDLRLRCRGYVSFYRWNQLVRTDGPLDLGQLRLVPGASVVGQVMTPEGPPDVAKCRVRLMPFMPGLAASIQEAKRWASRTLETTIDRDGFFSFEGLGPGVFSVEATQPGFAPASSGRFTVYERMESDLRRPIVLERPIALHLTISPAVSASGKEWGVVVGRREPGLNVTDTVFEGHADENGECVIHDLAPGDITIDVYQAPGSRLVHQDYQLAPGNNELLLKVALVRVVGRVFVGKEPLSAEIWFGRRTGAIKVRMQSDSNGDFVGPLPRDGTWPVQVTSQEQSIDHVFKSVEVKADRDTHEASVELHVPSASLEGVVVDEDDNGVAAAHVDLEDVSGGTLANATTKDGGRFSFRGVSSGPYFVAAADIDATGTRESSRLSVVVPAEGNPPSVRLVLRRKRVLEGVVRGDGEPIPGARVTFYGDWRSAAPSFGEVAMTDSLGAFKIAVGRDCREFLVYVMAPGFSFRAFDLSAELQGPVTLNVSGVGGDVSLSFPSDADDFDPAKAKWLLWQDGLPLLPPDLRTWSVAFGPQGSWTNVGKLLPRLGIGNYLACVVADQTQQIAALSFGAGVVGRCQNAFLSPGGSIGFDFKESGK
jgi:hypothetical protein